MKKSKYPVFLIPIQGPLSDDEEHLWKSAWIDGYQACRAEMLAAVNSIDLLTGPGLQKVEEATRDARELAEEHAAATQEAVADVARRNVKRAKKRDKQQRKSAKAYLRARGEGE